MTIESLRNEIDNIDAEIVSLLNKRYNYCITIGELKKNNFRRPTFARKKYFVWIFQCYKCYRKYSYTKTKKEKHQKLFKKRLQLFGKTSRRKYKRTGLYRKGI